MRKMKIVGTVTYLHESGKRLCIPLGECEIDDTSASNVVIHWKDQHGSVYQSTLTDIEFAQYQHNNTLFPL